MTYSVAAQFNQSTWDKFGSNWLRKAKAEKLKGFVIGDLTGEAKSKISDLGFELLPKSNLTCLDRCLLTKFNVSPKSDLSEEFDALCPIDSAMEVVDLVWPVSNLQNRAKVAQFLQQKIKDVYGGFFSSKYILGSQKFWTNFLEVEAFIQQMDYIDKVVCDDLMLNLYFAFFNSSMKIGVGNDY